MKFFTLFTTINNKPDYSAHKKEISSQLGGATKIVPTMDRLEKLKQSLTTRYNQKHKYSHESLHYLQTNAMCQQKISEPVEIDITKLSSINSEDLHNKLRERTTLLIDVRSKDDFESSQIKYPYCLNIPGNRIQNGWVDYIFSNLLWWFILRSDRFQTVLAGICAIYIFSRLVLVGILVFLIRALKGHLG